MAYSKSNRTASCVFFVSLCLAITTIRKSLDLHVTLVHKVSSPFLWDAIPPISSDAQKTPPQCIIFLHIPKVGGRTVGTFLEGVAASTGMKMQTLYSSHLREKKSRHSFRIQTRGDRNYIDQRDADSHVSRVRRGREDRKLIQGESGFTRKTAKLDSDRFGIWETSHRPLRPHYKGAINETNVFKNLSFNKTITTGHFTALLFQMFNSSKSCFKMTVLREPTSRAISAFFFHEHKYPSDVNSCLSPEGGEIFQRGSRRCRFKWQYSNDMTRRLAGLPDTKWLTFLENKYVASSPNQTHLDHAKDNLLHDFDLVCFLDNLPLCAQAIQNAFQFSSTIKGRSFNASMMNPKPSSKFITKSRPDSLDSTTMARFRAVNNLDIELYDWAFSKFAH